MAYKPWEVQENLSSRRASGYTQVPVPMATPNNGF